MPVTITHRRIKTTLRTALADTALFDDAHLVALLEAARAGKLVWSEPCQCLIGLSNYGYYHNYQLTRNVIAGMEEVELAFRMLDYPNNADEQDADWLAVQANDFTGLDARRNRRLVPMILREIRSRSRQPTGRTAQLSMAPSMAPATKFQLVD